MRVTTSAMVRLALTNVNGQRLRLAQTQEQASSGLRINRPSDDPTGASAALLLRSAVDATERYELNVTQARGRLAAIEGSIESVTNILLVVKERAVAGSTGTADRGPLADEVESLFEQVLAEGNFRNGRAHPFGGFTSSTAPFVSSGPFVPGFPAPTVSFVGDSNEIEVEIDAGVRSIVSFDGRRVFMGDADGDGSPDAGKIDVF